jgi:hypothetical protein
MKAWYRRWPFVSGLAIIVATNVIALGGVAFNRSGAPEGTFTLTRRELALPYNHWRGSEDSGLALTLIWRVEQTRQREGGGWFGNEGDWLDTAKLAQLGIRTDRPADEYDRSFWRGVPADVLLVLEMNGETYQRVLKRACDLAARSPTKDNDAACAREKNEATRLFVVDAGLDRKALREKYPDVRAHAIVHGTIQLIQMSGSSTPQVAGIVQGISTDEIQVPASMRAVIGPDDGTLWHSRDNARPFEALVTFGRRLEPWIVRLSPPSS